MATLNTTNIKHASSSSNNIVLAADGSTTISNLSGGVGKTLQVKQVVKTDTYSTSSSSFVDITGMSVSITPSSSSSKVLVQFHLGTFNNQNNASRAFVQMVRDSTAICVGDAATGHECSAAVCSRASDDNHTQFPVSMQFLDSPSTTSAVTYKLQASCGNDGGTLYLNRAGTQDAQAGNTASTITVQEVAV